jgi:antagonist of KipI
MIEVIQPGVYSSIQDSGRHGYEHYGMPSSGWLDPYLAAIANTLVGNPKQTPILEFALIGPTLRFHKECWIACAGSSSAYVVNGNPVSDCLPFHIKKGDVLEFTGMSGWFGYLAASGGFKGDRVLGSVSAYPAGGIGSALKKNQRLELGDSNSDPRTIRKNILHSSNEQPVSILQAMHTSLFSSSTLQQFERSDYELTSHSNRMGIRLAGTPIEAPSIRRSVPCLRGVIQIPPAGQPIIFGPEGPTSGGYPQIAILARISWTVLAQTRPGRAIQLRWMDIEQARQLQQTRWNDLESEDLWEPIR